MTKDYPSLATNELLTELEHAGRTPDLDLLRECLERPEELTPTLLKWLEEGSDLSWEDGEEIHAGHLLIAYREPAALPIFAEIYRDEDTCAPSRRWVATIPAPVAAGVSTSTVAGRKTTRTCSPECAPRGRVLNHVLAGERDPDLSGLPAALAGRVQERLAALKAASRPLASEAV